MKYKSKVLKTTYKLSKEKREYYKKHKKAYRLLHKDKKYKTSPEYFKNYYRKMKELVFKKYGMKCRCCGENTFEFLSIDHMNGYGRRHRKEIGGNFYNWLIKNNFPKGFQTLCHNCNQSKGLYGECPHKKN